MAGLSGAAYDPESLRAGLDRWFASRSGSAADVSPLRTNPGSGYSSQSFLFDVRSEHGGLERLVLRLPPPGGGLFPEYDLARQATTQNLLARHGIPAPSPAIHEPDTDWLGEDFMIMPEVAGRIPGDFLYCVEGWLHDAPPSHQRACGEAFADALGDLGRVPVDPDAWTFLHRPEGAGLHGELRWWRGYLDWATDGSPDGALLDAHQWASETAPPHDDLRLTWGDPRFANAVLTPAGAVSGLLDWEQAALGPAELDVGFWLSTRRQARAAVGVRTDPELPGLLSRAESVARIERRLGRRLRDIEWYEAYAMVRMGTCIAATQHLLRRSGQHDHFLLSAPLLPGWVRKVIAGEVHGA